MIMKHLFLSLNWKPSASTITGTLRRYPVKTVKVKRPGQDEQVLRWERHRPQQVLAKGPDDKTTSVQDDSEVYALFSCRGS